MSLQIQLKDCIQSALNPSVLNVINESHQHSGPGHETHFKLIVVSEAFEGQNRVQRHRVLNELLREWIGNPIHALSLQLFTPLEWVQRQEKIPASPVCRGGSKRS
jgi:BolA protein